MLQGVLAQRAPGDNDWDRLHHAFDQAMSRVGDGEAAHPYETRLTFQVWRMKVAIEANRPNAGPRPAKNTSANTMLAAVA